MSLKNEKDFNEGLKDIPLDDDILEEITEDIVGDEGIDNDPIANIDNYHNSKDIENIDDDENEDEYNDMEAEDELDELGVQMEDDSEDIDYDNFDDIDHL